MGGQLQFAPNMTPIEYLALDPNNPANASAGGATCLTYFQFLTRRQYATFTGKAVIGTGGFPYVLSDAVPANRYRVYLAVELNAGKGQSLAEAPMLFQIPPGIALPSLPPNSVSPNDPFFLNYRGADNAGPIYAGWRVDCFEYSGTTLDNSAGIGANSTPISMLGKKKYLLAGPGESLLGFANFAGTPSNANTYMEMRVLYAELLSTENFPVL